MMELTRNWMEVLRRCFRWRRHEMRLLPLQQIEEGPAGYTSTGTDPQFLLGSSRNCLPAGTVVVRVRSDSGAGIKLYIDRGGGFSEGDSVQLCAGRPVPTELGLAVKALRLDPCEREGSFRVGPVSVTEIGPFWMLLRSAATGLLLRRRPARLAPRQQVRVISGGFESLGSDPQFSVEPGRRGAPAGWTLVTVTGRGNGWALKPKVYIDDGRGFRESKTVRLTAQGNRYRALLNLGAGAAALRLDPCEHGGRFEIDQFLLTELGGLAAGVCRLFLRRKPRLADYAINSRHALAALRRKPLISVIMPVYDPDPRSLKAAIRSVRTQHYPNWELAIADDCSTNPEIARMLRRLAAKDSRVRLKVRSVRGNIAEASNTALSLAAGEFVALMDHDDELSPVALLRVAEEIDSHPDTDVIYTDEDKIDGRGTRFDPFYKPDWSPEYLLSMDYVSHLTVYRTSVVREVGGFRSQVNGAQDHDLFLRVTRRTSKVRHIPATLYHWRAAAGSTAAGIDAKPYTVAATQLALEDYLTSNSICARVEPGKREGLFRVRYEIRGAPLVSILIPSGLHMHTRLGGVTFLERCVASIREKSTWKNYEILVVEGGSVCRDRYHVMDRLGVRRLCCPGPRFNYSLSVNMGAAEARGEHLLLLNDDTEVISPDWMESLLEYSQMAEIGAVGARLLYPDNTIQHGGVIAIGGQFVHPYAGAPAEDTGYFDSLAVVRNYLSVTAACLMTKASLFRSVGGLDERFPLEFNDVDFCLRLHQLGFRNVYTPYAELYHYETPTRSRQVNPADQEAFDRAWAQRYPQDPYYNINLSDSFPYGEE